MADVKGDYIEESFYAWDEDNNEVLFTYKIYGFSEFPRDKRGWCAFCHADPCAEQGDGLIALLRQLEGDKFETCPVCDGRPT